MSAAMTLFQLRGDAGGLFDGSVNGVGILRRTNAAVLSGDAGIALKNGAIDVARHKDLDDLQAFTIDATVSPAKIGPRQQTIVEGQSPAVALYVDPKGKLVGRVHAASGWVTVDSGASRLKAGAAQRVTFTRDKTGKLELQIAGKRVGAGTAPGQVQSVGEAGLRVGMAPSGSKLPFVGTLVDLSVRQGVVTQKFFTQKAREAKRLETVVKNGGVIKQISVHLLPDESHARLQHVKDIMNAAGVQTLSDLDRLPINQRTPLARGQMLVAPKKSAGPKVKWPGLVKAFRTGDVGTRRELLAAHLTNQNSAEFLGKLAIHPAGAPASAPPPPVLPSSLRTQARVPEPRLQTSDIVKLTGNKPTAVDGSLLQRLKARVPAMWPTTSPPAAQVFEVATIPIDSAVVIAGTLDLTQQQLVVEPNVVTLYVIAEEVICGNNAAITWRRPGGVTPDRADNPDLNGRSFPGVQTKTNSRDGLDGTDGMPGDTGTPGAAGRNAPNLEMWVKNMTGLPNLDFDGEDGITGGRGQRGGSGGSGGGGAVGKRVWFFGWHCVSDPGDGGDGGNGARGGDGGRGGNGSSGGTITVGVLTGTLATTVANKSFRIKNQGGRRAGGGASGAGGAGGRGGRSGNGETCHSAKDGHDGAQGQPGSVGASGFTDGGDAQVTFLEFTEAAWDDLMTRPWITELTPAEAFPGDTLVVRGSRFTAADQVVVGGSALASTVNADESLSVTLPMTIGGGEQQVFVRRADGIESNRLNVGIKPELDPFTDPLAQGSTVTLNGRAFFIGATVLFNGGTIPATVAGASALTFAVPGTGGAGSAGGTVTIQVRNPDGRVSNSRTATQPRILEVPFKYGQHNLSFPNFDKGAAGLGHLRGHLRHGGSLARAARPRLRPPGADRGVFRILRVLSQGEGQRRARDRLLHVAREPRRRSLLARQDRLAVDPAVGRQENADRPPWEAAEPREPTDLPRPGAGGPRSRGRDLPRDRGDIPARHGSAEPAASLLHPLRGHLGLGLLRPAIGLALRDAVPVRLPARRDRAAADTGWVVDSLRSRRCRAVRLGLQPAGIAGLQAPLPPRRREDPLRVSASRRRA